MPLAPRAATAPTPSSFCPVSTPGNPGEPESSARGFCRLGLFAFLALEVERHGRADQIPQGRLIDLFTFADVDGAPDVPVEAGVEQARGILQRSSFGEG